MCCRPLDEVDDELDDEQAARASAATATPAVATCCLRRKCISGTPYGFIGFLAVTSSLVILHTVVPEYSLPAPRVPAGK